MKILYHHRTQSNNAEGVHVREMAESLRDLGNEVYVVSPPGIDPFLAEKPRATQGRRVRNLWGWISNHLPKTAFELAEIAYNLVAYYNIRKVLQKEKIDFVYERFTFFGYAGMRCAKRFRVPFILEVNYTTRTVLFRRKSRLFLSLARHIEKKNFFNAHAIFVVSSVLRAQLIRLGVPEEKIYLAPNAVSEKVFSHSCNGASIRDSFNLSGNHVVGFVGGFYPWHGLDFLLKAVKEAEQEKSNMCVFLVGEGPMRRALTKLAAQLNLSSRIVFAGAVKYADLPAYITAMDICVLPDSNSYGSPMKIFEYMAMGKAVIAPRLSPIEDVITDKVNGLLFEAGDKGSFKRCLLDLMNNKQAREKIGEEARRTVFSRHLWRLNAEKVVRAYRNARHLPDRMIPRAG